jgi:hypothetical protein
MIDDITALVIELPNEDRQPAISIDSGQFHAPIIPEQEVDQNP